MLGGNVVDVDLIVLSEVTGFDYVLKLNSGEGLLDAKTIQVSTKFVNAMVGSGRGG